jgi:hypothetical protein
MINKTDICNKTNVYSWGVIIDFTINSRGGFLDVDETSFSLLWHHDLILTLEPRKIHPQLADAGSRGFRLVINATDTASKAKNIGEKVAYSLLDFCIQRRWGVAFSWHDSPLPFRVIDRTPTPGMPRMTIQSFGTVTGHVKVSEFANALESSFSYHDKIKPSLLLSMELYASSHFENNQRSKLIMIMSSLEALAEQEKLSERLGSTIEDLKEVINKSAIQDENLKNSLRGQIDSFKRESVRSAIQRLLKNSQIGKEDIKFVDQAYSARSKIVHEGQRVPELSTLNSKLENVLISVYKYRSG